MIRMVSRRMFPATALLLASTALLGCGSATKTVTVANTPTEATHTTATQGVSSAPTTPTAPSNNGGTPATSTRTAPEPAFTEHETSKVEGVEAASALLHAHGYTPADPSQYHSNQTLKVLVGTRTGSADGHGQQAFFFVAGHYIGTDAKEASASVRVVSQSDTEVALSYALYRSADSLCCPSGGQATVHFQLNNGQLAPLEAIPPATSKTGLSRN